MSRINLLNNTDKLNFFNSDEKKAEKKKDDEIKISDRLNISGSAKVFNKIDNFLNLGKPDRLDISGFSSGEREEFLKILSKLLKEGIVGYEYLEVDGKKEKHFIVNQLKNDRIRGAKLWNERRDGKDISKL